MVNRGEEKVRVHMNVAPRSTGNTNSGTELILCSTICVPSATRHNIHVLLLAASCFYRNSHGINVHQNSPRVD